MSDIVLKIDRLTKRYGEITAVDDLTLEVTEGEVFGFLGPNGAGKTTTLRIISGILDPTSGYVKVGGSDTVGDKIAVKQQVGYLPEQPVVARHHNAYTALEFYGQLSGLSCGEIRRRRDRLLRMVNLADWSGVSVKKYSKGMLQRLALAQALLHDPDLLILDEPTDGLDPVGRSDVRRILSELKNDGKTIFLNSHLHLYPQ